MNSRRYSFIDQEIGELYRAEPITVSDVTNRVRCILREFRNYEEELIDASYKYLFHEIIPIVSAMKYLGYTAGKMEFTGHDCQIDGKFHLPNGQQQNIEVTTAINPGDKNKRRKFYLQYGYEPIPNQRAKTRPLKELPCDLEENSSSSIKARYFDDKVLFPTMEKALCDKVQKANKNKMYHGAWLILVIDDFICPPSIDAEARGRRFDPLCQRLLTNKDQWAPFFRVFVIGISGTYIFDSKTGQGCVLSQLGDDILDGPIAD